MKRKLIIKQNGKIIKELECEVRDISHLNACINYPSQVYKKKKGKGSYTRKEKYKKDYSEE